MTERRTYADRREYLIKAVQRRHKELRRKDFGISSRGYTRSWGKIREELDKCVLLCANCHREVHAGLQLPRETVVETSGEFREAYSARNGNLERSLPKGIRVGRNVQRLEAEEPCPITPHKRPTPFLCVMQSG